MTTYTIRSWERDRTGLVLHTVEVDGVVKRSGLGYSKAVKLVEQWANDGDIIQEAYRDQPPYHRHAFDHKYTITASGRLS